MKLENTQSLDRMAKPTANLAEMTMVDCVECKHLQRAFEIRLIRYNQARSAAFYRVSSELAAKQNVAMERAKNDLEEHNLVCSFQQPSVRRPWGCVSINPVLGWKAHDSQ